MKIVIIEDERLTAEDLKDLLLQIEPKIKVMAILTSVEEALAYFQQNPVPDLIFSDIQLGDGLSFEIFDRAEVNAPIIFCTAYNEYALNAFKTNGIHYILKPFDKTALREALEKYEALKAKFEDTSKVIKDLKTLFKKERPAFPTSVLVYHKDQIIPIKLEDIALFYIKNGVTHIRTFNRETYFINKTLNEIEDLANTSFYRANRQVIIHRNTVESVAHRLSRKASLILNIPFNQPITVSKEKLTEFLEWLEGN